MRCDATGQTDLERQRAEVALVEQGLHQALHQRVRLLGLSLTLSGAIDLSIRIVRSVSHPSS
jgi:hypothetical protein